MGPTRAMLSLLLALWGAVLGSAGARAAGEAPYVGKVLKGVGEARIVGADGLSRKAVEGSYFHLADSIVTGATGRVKLLFNERSSLVVVGADSVLLIEKANAGGAGERLGTRLGLRRGELRVSIEPGSYSGRGEEVFEVRTPNAVAGVRGTVFLVGYDPKAQSTLLATESGRVSFASGDSQTYVEGGRFSRAAAGLVSNPERTPRGGAIESRLRQLERDGAEGEQAASDEDGGRSPASERGSGNRSRSQALGGLAKQPVAGGPVGVRGPQLYDPRGAERALERGEDIRGQTQETQRVIRLDRPVPRGDVSIPIEDARPSDPNGGGGVAP